MVVVDYDDNIGTVFRRLPLGHSGETSMGAGGPRRDYLQSMTKNRSPHAGESPPDRDPVVEAYKRDIDRTLLRENLDKSVEERLTTLVALQRLAEEARRAGRSASRRN